MTRPRVRSYEPASRIACVRPCLGRSPPWRGWSSGSSPWLLHRRVPSGWDPQVSGSPRSPQEVQEALAGTLGAFGTLERELAELRARLEIVEELAERLEGRILDLRSIERRLAAASHGLRLVLAPGEEAGAYVRWLDSRGRGRQANLVLGAAPIALGDMLRESLFERAESAVLTSATLSTRKRFDFLRSRLGLESSATEGGDEPLEVKERIIMSPFDFASNTVLCIPTDLPAAERGDPDFQEATARVVVELAEMSGGGIFVLFTSHQALRRVAEPAPSGRGRPGGGRSTSRGREIVFASWRVSWRPGMGSCSARRRFGRAWTCRESLSGGW